MLFSEIYNCYFQSVAGILTEAVEKKLTGKRMTEIIRRNAFSESFFVIEDALKSEEWPLVTKDYKTPIKQVPTQPLTILQKRWMKSLLLDTKLQLFAPDNKGLEDVQPLFTPDMFVYFDRYQDSDPYQNENYIANFRIVLEAFSTKKGLQVNFVGRTGREHIVKGKPLHLEYSAKDDKFRLKIIPTEGAYRDVTEVNMARILSCYAVEVQMDETIPIEPKPSKKVILELTDERNALSRAMLQFSYLEKETEQLEENRYKITLYYDRNDETELLIQILGFGPSLRVVEPQEFIEKIKERLEKQIKWK